MRRALPSSVLLLALAGSLTAVLPTSPAAAAGSVQLVSSSSYVDALGSVNVSGQVVNGTGMTVSGVAVVIDVIGTDGTLLDTDTAYALTDTLDAGERSGFTTSFDPPAGYDHYSVRSVSGSPAYRPANHRFSIEVTNEFADEYGGQHLVGTVTNNNTTAAEFTEVDVTFLDESGTAVGADLTFPTTADGSSALAPGESDSWEITRYDGPAYASYELVADSLSDPTPLPTTWTIAGGGTRTVGQAVPVSGRLTKRGTTTGADGVRVSLLQRRAGVTSWSVAATGTTDYDGRVSFSPKPAFNTSYMLYVSATSTRAASGSAVKTAVMNARVTSALSTTSTTLGHSATIKATVAPNESGRTVTLQRIVSGKWANVASHALNSSSQWTFTVKPGARGTYVYRTVVGATGLNGAGASPAVGLKIT